MSNLHSFTDSKTGCFANVRMENGNPCYVSVAQTGVLVKKSKVGWFGAKLYEEKNAYRAAMAAKALHYLYPVAVHGCETSRMHQAASARPSWSTRTWAGVW